MPHILLIDDDSLFRRMVCATLQEAGHTVTEARDGAEGLALHTRVAADLVLTDLIMPEKEGIETIIELRKKNPGVKIIAMSGGGRMSSVQLLRIASQVGAQRVLIKPFSGDELLVTITAILAEETAGPEP
jgi:DNA-binding response OmpR family regulator